MSKEKYEKPSVEKIEYFVVEDIMTASTKNDDDLFSHDEYDANKN